jgi:hypothetical protein
MNEQVERRSVAERLVAGMFIVLAGVLAALIVLVAAVFSGVGSVHATSLAPDVQATLAYEEPAPENDRVHTSLEITQSQRDLWLLEETGMHHLIVHGPAITQSQRDLWLLEEVGMHGLIVAPLAIEITQLERDLWLLEEVNMQHLAPWEPPSIATLPLDWIWTDLQLLEEPGLHHLLPPGSSR